MECPLSYQEILDAYTVNRWDTGQHFCIRVTVPDGSVLLKVNIVYTWYVIFFVGISNISSSLIMLMYFDLAIDEPNWNRNHEVGNGALLNNIGPLALC